MDVLSQWWDRFVQSVVWKSFFGYFQRLDWVIFAILVAGVIYGIKKGFWKTISDLIRILIVLILTLEYDGKLSRLLENRMPGFPASAALIASFIMATILIWFVMSFIVRHLRKMFSTKTSFLIRLFGGSLLGAIYFFILLSFVSQLVFISPWEGVKKAYRENAAFSIKYIEKGAPKIHETIMRPIHFLTKT